MFELVIGLRIHDDHTRTLDKTLTQSKQARAPSSLISPGRHLHRKITSAPDQYDRQGGVNQSSTAKTQRAEASATSRAATPGFSVPDLSC